MNKMTVDIDYLSLNNHISNNMKKWQELNDLIGENIKDNNGDVLTREKIINMVGKNKMPFHITIVEGLVKKMKITKEKQNDRPNRKK